MNKLYLCLSSTVGNKTFFMTNHDINTLVVFENPSKTLDSTNHSMVVYNSIQILKLGKNDDKSCS